ncbi:MAG: hypothetical protein O2937_02295 [Bacteroidetes bacterium]|nr:hypothetical protein [Bacteroidota bacterium]
MKTTLFKITSLTTALIFSSFNIFAQNEGQSGGGESAAEASVSTSSSKKAAAAPETIESNPVVTLVKTGLPLTSAINIPVSTIIKIANAGGTIENLKLTSSAIASGGASITSIVAAVDAGIKRSKDGSNLYFLDVAKKLETGDIAITELADVKSNLDSGVDLATQITFGIADTKTAIAGGYTPAEILEVSVLDDAARAARKQTIVSVAQKRIENPTLNLDKDQLEDLIESSGDEDLTDDQLNAIVALSKYLTDVKATTSNISLQTSIDAVVADADYSSTTLQAALSSAVLIADKILADVTESGTTSLTTDDTFKLSSLTESGYNTELIKLLIKYGAIGDKGSDLAAAALNGFSTTSSSSSSLSSFLSSSPSTSDYLGLLSTLTGDSGIGDADGDNNDFLNPQTNTVLDVSMDKVSLAPGSNITLGSKQGDTSIDVSSILTKATNHADRKILVVGAAKDLTIAGDTTFTNTNDVEDHALVLGAADELYFRSTYSSANAADYANPDPVTLEYTGSNLGLGSESEMRLVNVNIKTGGNLAIGTLDNLYIGQDSNNNLSTFTVGTGGKNSDPDNIYMYANELIKVNGLAFAGRVDDVYMDAITIDLANVSFPSNSDVMLRSRDGGLNFGNTQRTVGDVNFIENVRHLSISDSALTASDFDYSKGDGHINSTSTLPNGTSHIKIRGR